MKPTISISGYYGVLQSRGDLLSLPGFRDQPFEFDPCLSDAELPRFLDSPPAGASWSLHQRSRCDKNPP